MSRPEAPIPEGTRTLVVDRAGRPAALRTGRFLVRVERGPDAGASFECEERATVGTSESAAVKLGDPAVSRLHAELVVAPEGLVVRDLGSTNGTFSGGIRLVEGVVPTGTRVSLGETTLVVDSAGEGLERPLHADDRFGPLLGRTPAMRRLFDVLARVSQRDVSVLLEGESGTGKELVAQAVHDASPRAAGPLVVVDCGSLPAALVESELFGHVKGAFTGASADRRGAFESASGGTLFLDEIGELPLELQPRLLRALERREVKRVGADRYHAVDVRVVAATNRDLRAEVNAGRFREDLYFRLAVVRLVLPPLRERPADVALLARAMLADLSVRDGVEYTLSEATLAELAGRPWRGNVRELRNYVEALVALGSDPGAAFGPVSAPPAAAAAGAAGGSEVAGGPELELPYKLSRGRWLDRFERAYVPALLARCGGNISRAAREAGIDRVYMLRLMDKLGLRDRGA